MEVGTTPTQEPRHGVDHASVGLRSARTVEIRDRPSLELPIQRREARPNRTNIDHGVTLVLPSIRA